MAAEIPNRSVDVDLRRAEDRVMEARLSALAIEVAGINARLEATLPTLATKTDLAQLAARVFKTMNGQTWKFVSASLAYSSALVAAVYFIAHHAP